MKENDASDDVTQEFRRQAPVVTLMSSIAMSPEYASPRDAMNISCIV